jgi:large subunit ribosomal protein L18
MQSKSKVRRESRQRRHVRLRAKVRGTTQRPRLVVHRSANHITAQVIDDSKGVTLVSAATYDEAMRSKTPKGGNIKAAQAIGEAIAMKALEKSITTVVFDRGGFDFHGRIKALADSARAKGLKF